MINCLQQEQQVAFTARVDASQYNDQELVSIKTSLNLPYYTNSGNFERAYGSIHVDGVDYEYVKRRVYNDTLELLCLPNKDKTNLQVVKNLFFKFSTDDQTSPPSKKSQTTLKSGLPDFVQELNVVGFLPFIIHSIQQFEVTHSSVLPGYVTMMDRPPGVMQLFV